MPHPILRKLDPSGRLRELLPRLQRVRPLIQLKRDDELRFWVEDWDPVIRAGGFNPGDALTFLDGEEPDPTYLGRRWQQARAEVRRVIREAAIEDERFFEGKVVLDIGCGPLGFPDACPARLSIGLDPLATRYAERGLLIPDSPALYLSARAEKIPLASNSVDVVVARNCLDHVEDPDRTLKEMQRVLRPGGTLILNFDVEHYPTVTEPHPLTADRVRAGLSAMTITRELAERNHGPSAGAIVLVAQKR